MLDRSTEKATRVQSYVYQRGEQLSKELGEKAIRRSGDSVRSMRDGETRLLRKGGAETAENVSCFLETVSQQEDLEK